MPEDTDEYYKCHNISSRNPKINYAHQNQEDRADDNRDHGRLTDGSRNPSKQHTHAIDRFARL